MESAAWEPGLSVCVTISGYKKKNVNRLRIVKENPVKNSSEYDEMATGIVQSGSGFDVRGRVEGTVSGCDFVILLQMPLNGFLRGFQTYRVTF